MTVQNPISEIRKLVTHGKVSVGVDILDALFDLSGQKRASKRVGKWWLHSNVAQQQKALDQDYTRWFDDCRNALRRMSIYRRGLSSRGNSRMLLSRFSKTRQYVKSETRLHHGLAFLEGLMEQELIHNDNLSDYLKAVQAQSHARESALNSVRAIGRAKATLRFPGAENIQRMLQSCPDEGEAISGAVSVYESRGPDANRQALASCRNGLEKVICRLSGEGDWKKGLAKLTRSRTKQKFIRIHTCIQVHMEATDPGLPQRWTPNLESK